MPLGRVVGIGAVLEAALEGALVVREAGGIRELPQRQQRQRAVPGSVVVPARWRDGGERRRRGEPAVRSLHLDLNGCFGSAGAVEGRVRVHGRLVVARRRARPARPGTHVEVALALPALHPEVDGRPRQVQSARDLALVLDACLPELDDLPLDDVAGFPPTPGLAPRHASENCFFLALHSCWRLAGYN